MIKSLRDLRPGDIGFGPIDGLVGFGVALGQLALGDEARFRHVFVVTDIDVGQGEYLISAVEAMPSGARKVLIGDRWTDQYAYVRLPTMRDAVGHGVADRAERMIGTPYGWADYAALALKHWGVKSRRLDDFIAAETLEGYPRRAICSQLADKALALAGVHVFQDGRLPQDVTPGALFYQMLRMGGQVAWGGA